MVSSFLTFVILTLMSLDPRSSPTIAPSKEKTFSRIPPCFHRNESWICLPAVKYLVLRLKRFGAHAEVLSKVSSDVLGLTRLLERLLGHLLDLDCCKLFLIPVDRQLSWCCDIKLDEICRSSSECELQRCYTPVHDRLISDSCCCLHKLSFQDHRSSNLCYTS